MSSLNRAKEHFESEKFDSSIYTIGHLSDDTAKLYARDMFLIGYDEESDILSENDTSRYTAILDRINGQACEVFFDKHPEAEAISNAYEGRGKH